MKTTAGEARKVEKTETNINVSKVIEIFDEIVKGGVKIKRLEPLVECKFDDPSYKRNLKEPSRFSFRVKELNENLYLTLSLFPPLEFVKANICYIISRRNGEVEFLIDGERSILQKIHQNLREKGAENL